MNQPRSRLVQAVQPPEITDGRIARQWASIEQRLPRRDPGRGTVWYSGLAVLPLVAAGMVWIATRGAPVPTAGAVIESAGTPVTVTLRDGSTLGLNAQTKLHLLRDQEQAVDVELGGGKASFDVSHVKGRVFRVHAGLVLVRVLGTRFEVAKSTRSEGSHIQVAVARGVVEVQRRDGTGGVRRLNAGETWSALIPTSAVARPALVQPESPPLEAAVQENLQDTPAPPAEVGPTEPAAAERPPAEPSMFPSSPAPAPRAATGRATKPSARERVISPAISPAVLLKRANLARRSGQMRESADAYTELLRRFPDDGRAGLAAFELGRIRMDALAQPKAAVEAFSVALRTTPRASFREDALARIVVASDSMGDQDACRQARDHYQREFPAGVHALALAARCVSSKR